MESTSALLPESRLPTRFAAIVFSGKATALQMRRAARDMAQGIQRHRQETLLLPHVLAESRTPLWNLSPNEAASAEEILQDGKVQNLRAALKNLNGAIIQKGEVFSFWKQIGRATKARGFVNGRLLREGCLMPAVGGGLCQLSNALYDAALQSGLEIVERWAHSRVVPNSSAAVGRDATVAWNYIDLRFRADFNWQIESEMSADELIVRFRCARLQKTSPLIPLDSLLAPRPTIDAQKHSCVSCGVEKCFRNAPQFPQFNAAKGATFWLVDARSPEFETYLATHKSDSDGILLPLANAKQSRYAWHTDGFAFVGDARSQTLRRTLTTRRLAAYGARRLMAQLKCDENLARALAKQIPPHARHLIVAQSLLPFLWREGVLGGRTFEVLATRLPLKNLHQKLDDALARFPDRATLGEFRAPPNWVEAESAAFEAATKIVTPHSAIAALFGDRVEKLDWSCAPAQSAQPSGDFTLLFPGPTAARKGAYEVREAARSLGVKVLLYSSSELEGDDFWDGVPTRRASSTDWHHANVVVQPALVEENPRLLLAALAAKIPVIATASCGLDAQPNLFLIPENDAAALIETLKELRRQC